jgi:hypothetical protein
MAGREKEKHVTLSTLLGYWTGLAFVAPSLDLGTLAGTGLVVNVCNAIMCRLIAANTGRDPRAWTIAGLVGGIWVVGVLALLPSRADGDARPT